MSYMQEVSDEAEFKPLNLLLDEDFIDQITSDFRVQRNWKVKIVTGVDFDPQDVSYRG